jgi:serine/threonine protein kinase
MPKCPHCEQEHEDLLHFCPVTGKPIELGKRMVGQTLLDRYEVTDILGGSSIGGVYKAVDKESEDLVTLKMLHPSLGRQAELVDPYMADVRTVGGIRHENLGEIFQTGKDVTGAPIVIRRFLEGPSLAEVIEKHPKGMKPAAAVYLLTGVLRALDAIHNKDVFNGDLTPRDVFVVEGENGEAVPKLAEVGERHIKSALPPEEAEKPENRQYLAPEQVRDGASEPSTDIFSAGVIFYQLLTGKLPYPNGIPGRPEKIPAFDSPSQVREHVPKPFDYTIRRALALYPRDRFKTPGLFADALKSSMPAEAVTFAELLSGVAGEAESPPGTVPVPFDEEAAPPAAEEPRPEARRPEPSSPAAEKPAPAPAPEKPIVPKGPSKAPTVKPSKRVDHSEESLTPIMPSRFAKWFIIGGIVAGIVVIVVLGRTVYLMATGGYEKTDLMDFVEEGGEKGGDDEGDEEEEGEGDEEEAAAATEPAPDAEAAQDAPAEPAAAEEPPPEAETVSIALKIEPADASVWLDGNVSVAPHEWSLPKDGASHTYKVGAEGYETVEFKFVADKDRTLEATLEKKPVVKITLKGVPAGAEVNLDGSVVSAPYEWTFEPSKQPHSYTIGAEGYELCEGAFVPDKTRSVTCKLKKLPEEPEPTEPVPPPEKKPEKKPTKKPTKKPGKKPGKKGKKTGGGFVDEVPF